MSCELCGHPFQFFKSYLKGRTSQYICKKCSHSFWNRFAQKAGAEAPQVDMPSIEALVRLEQKVDKIMQALRIDQVPQPRAPSIEGLPISDPKAKERAEVMEELRAVLLVRRKQVDRLATNNPSSDIDC